MFAPPLRIGLNQDDVLALERADVVLVAGRIGARGRHPAQGERVVERCQQFQPAHQLTSAEYRVQVRE
ncbi:MAG: hypothetical protein E6J87_06545 [Deltaproteobacteria bacterium]|nr:MAG: hypothetical protein E6J87_06545 [Deltaproteobacteria bacterium]